MQSGPREGDQGLRAAPTTVLATPAEVPIRGQLAPRTKPGSAQSFPLATLSQIASYLRRYCDEQSLVLFPSLRLQPLSPDGDTYGSNTPTAKTNCQGSCPSGTVRNHLVEARRGSTFEDAGSRRCPRQGSKDPVLGGL